LLEFPKRSFRKTMETEQIIAATAWVGRQQAFAIVASHCSAAQAQCLREIKETGAYQQLGVTWEEFCPQYAGITRVYADALIRRLDEFGDAFFKLSQLARVSPATYRQIADQVHDDVIEIDGQPIALIPENAKKIRAGIQRLHAQAQDAKSRTHHSIVELQMRLEAILREVSNSASRPLPMSELAALRGMCLFSINKWRALSKILEAAKPA
jgi:hypothetical protein